MTSIETLLAITLFVVSTTITPGPNNIMIMTSGLNYGISRSLPHLLGICFGFPLMVLAIGLGLGTLFEQYPGIHEVIKYLGIAYMLFLAWKIATSHTDVNKTRAAKPLSFIQAALFQWVNPKAWVMSVTAMSVYTNPANYTFTVLLIGWFIFSTLAEASYTSVAADAYLQALIIALTFLLLSFPCVGLWLFFGLSLKNILASETQQKYFNFGMGAVLAASVLPMLTL